MSQETVILAHLKAGHRITPASAYELCGTLALHSRISDLRKAGHDISGKIITQNGKRHGEYWLAQQNHGAPTSGRAAASKDPMCDQARAIPPGQSDQPRHQLDLPTISA